MRGVGQGLCLVEDRKATCSCEDDDEPLSCEGGGVVRYFSDSYLLNKNVFHYGVIV